MRYDTPIFFQTLVKGEYDPTTGNYEEVSPVEAKKFANVTDSGTEMLQLVYGKLKQGSLTIRLQRPYTEAFDRIRIGDKIFKADMVRRNKVFVVSEVQ